MTFLRPQFPGPGADPVASDVHGGASPFSVSTVGVIEGDLCIYAATTRDSIPDVLGPEGGGWTEGYTSAMSTNDIATMWYKIAGGAEPATWDWSHSAGTNAAAAMGAWRGPTMLVDLFLNTALPSVGMPSGGRPSFAGSLWLGFFHLALLSGGPTLTYPLNPAVEAELNNQICNIYSVPLSHGQPAPNMMFETTSGLAVADAAMAVFT